MGEDPWNISVHLDGMKVPVASLRALIEPDQPVRAIVTSDFTLREEWPRDLCRRLLDAMGYGWATLPQHAEK